MLRLHRSTLCLALWGSLGLACAQPLPADIASAVAQAHIDPQALALLVFDVDRSPADPPRLAWRNQVPMNPASVMKLVTTFAALDLLGPAYTWNTPVYLDGSVRHGTLEGNVYIKGSGDPQLVLERLWLLLRRLQGLGVRQIQGDIVLDRSAFVLPEADAARFDGEALRPYNATPDALLINYKSVLLTLHPDAERTHAQVQYDPPLYGVQEQTSVPLLGGACGDYRARLRADFSDPAQIRLAGGYPASCGDKLWPVAYADPASYAPRAVQGLWLEMGNRLSGQVRYGRLPARLEQAGADFAQASAPLADVVRDINKFSNNVMAQQLFLTLGLVVDAGQWSPRDASAGNAATGLVPAGPPAAEPGSFAAARATVQGWWRQRFGAQDLPLLENGSGLSRQERISAQGLGTLLQAAYRSPVMPELLGSLPVPGVDGTLRRSPSHTSAHLKTGTLDGVIARAGYVDSKRGKRYVFVALLNHPDANSEAARQLMDSLVDWTARDN